MANLFHDAEDIPALIYQLVGAGSTCWENLSGTGVFQDEKAKKFAEDALIRLEELRRNARSE